MGSASQACFAEAASSPVQSCLLFSVMKINETVQPSAKATEALLTEEAFRLCQPFPASYHDTSEMEREGKTEGGQCSSVLQKSGGGKRASQDFSNAECQW